MQESTLTDESHEYLSQSQRQMESEMHGTADESISTAAQTSKLVVKSSSKGDCIPIKVKGCEGAYIDYLRAPLHVISKEVKGPKRKRKGPRGGVVCNENDECPIAYAHCTRSSPKVILQRFFLFNDRKFHFP